MNGIKDVPIALARIDERLKALVKDIDRAERDSERRIELARSELAHRLEVLNGAHQEAVKVQNTYIPRDVFEARLKDVDARIGAVDTDAREQNDRTREAVSAAEEKLEKRMGDIELDAREQRGRLWLPMLAIAGVAAALASVAAKLLFP